jgi:MFS transporter, ACDE family, multidrug resistance protein
MVTEAAARMAAESGRGVHVVHAAEAAIGGDVGVYGEGLDAAGALVSRHLEQLAMHRVPAEGQILLHATDHGAAGRMVAEYANAVGAAAIVIGAPTHGGLTALIDESSSRELMRLAQSHVLIINPAAPVQSAMPVAAETAGAL